MRSIDTYISEAISSHKNTPKPKYHTPFPKNRMDKDGIIDWLNENGFEQISDLEPMRLVTHHRLSGKGCFNVSSYNPRNKHTYWIRIYDGEKFFIIRTCLVKDMPRGTAMCKVHVYPFDDGKRIDFNDIRKYFDEQLITEAISSRGNSPYNYTPFPAKRTDHEGIIEWLEENGFTKLNGFTVEQLINHHRETGEKCYQSGKKMRDKGTHWIRFYDGNVVIFIRTCDMSYLLRHRELRICTMKDPEDSSGGEVSYEEIVKYFK
jgi:hypothetical protein